jgi:8-oxo-dGTP diphosphatase
MTAQTTDRSRAPRPVTAVGVVVFRDDRVLLVRRGRAPSRGLWAVPGGAVEAGETLAEAAEREVGEETGVVVNARGPVHAFDAISRRAEGAIEHHYVVIDLIADYVSGEPKAGDDAEDAAWVAIDEIGNLAISDETARLVRRLYGSLTTGADQCSFELPAANSRSSDPSRSKA